jgi:hypothetical protein
VEPERKPIKNAEVDEVAESFLDFFGDAKRIWLRPTVLAAVAAVWATTMPVDSVDARRTTRTGKKRRVLRGGTVMANSVRKRNFTWRNNTPRGDWSQQLETGS